MIGDFGQTPQASPEGAAKMFVMDGRDQSWGARSMGNLFAHATSLNLLPLRWEVGLFIIRDLVEARDPHFRHRPWKRPSTMWGCDVKVVGMDDQVILVAKGLLCGREGEIHRFSAEG